MSIISNTSRPTPVDNALDDAVLIASAVPAASFRVIDVIEEAGHEAWLVGGCVRDALLERPIHDVDLCTNATWQAVRDACEAHGMRTHETGVKHGTITVMCDGEAFEVTTFRCESEYSDGRRPDRVQFVQSVDEDLARRDFTVNAMAFHPKRGLRDPYRGREDLSAGVIRAVGDALVRFDEDALRIMRAVRFSSQLGFAIDPACAAGMREALPGLSRIAAERIATELTALLCGSHVRDALMDNTDIICGALPELAPMRGFEQMSRYHIYDVFEHTAWVVQRSPQDPTCRWAALLHDSGKPHVFFVGPDGYGHFYGHADESVEIASNLLKRLKMPTRLTQDTCQLIALHDYEIPARPKAVKRMLAQLGGREDLFRLLLGLKRADALAHAPEYQSGVALADEVELILDEVIAEQGAFTLKQLAVTGSDVIAAGVPQGPEVGRVLSALLDAVIDDDLPNDREALLARTRALMH